MSNARRERPPSPTDWSKQMTRREWTETWVRWAEKPGGIPRYAAVAAEIRALWRVYDEYAAAIEELGGTLPPALDEYHGGQE